MVCLICFLCIACRTATTTTTTLTTTTTKTASSSRNTYYVSTSGNDRHDGTLAFPWLTIQHAANVAKAGDTVNVEAGAYASGAISFSASGSAGNYITFQNYNGGTVNIVIDGAVFDAIQIGYGGTGNYIKLIGFKVFAPASQVGIDVWGSHDIVQNCYVTDCESSGIGAGPSATYVVVDGCEVTGTNTLPQDEMISFSGVDHFEIKNCLVHDAASAERVGVDCKQGCSNGSIHNNIVRDTEDGGIYIDCQGVNQSNISVYDNLCYNHPNAAGLSIADETGNATSTNISFYNNVVYNCRMGFDLNQTGSEIFNFSLINNTFYNNNNGNSPDVEIHINTTHQYLNNCIIRNNIIYSLTAGIYAIMYDDYANGGLTVDHNLFYNSGEIWASGNVLGTSAVTSNPLLINPTSDFSLTPSSPAIDAGSSVGAPSTDYIETVRPQGATYDIGAYEYIISASPAVTTSAASSVTTSGATLNGSLLTLGSTNPVTFHPLPVFQLPLPLP